MAAVIRSSMVIFFLALAGAIGTWAASGLGADRGDLGPTILQSQSPLVALVSVFIVVGLISVLGGFLSRMTTFLTGMFLVGFLLFAMSLQLHDAREFILTEGNITMLSLEAVVIATIILFASYLVFKIGGELEDVQKKTDSPPSNPELISLLISLIVIPVVWLIATSPDKAQVIGTAAVAGIIMGFLVRQFLPTMQPVIIYSMPTAVGGLGYLIALLISPTDGLALMQQSISPLLYPMPIDYAAGSVMGLSIGLSWAASLAQSKETSQSQVGA